MKFLLFRPSVSRKVISIVGILSLSVQLFSPMIAYANSAPTSKDGGCGVSTTSGPATSAQVGGVKLDLAATFLANMTDITGAYYDQSRNVIVFVGQTNATLPQFNKDDLAVAIRSEIFNNADPAVSIDFKDLSNILAYPTMKVDMYGGIEDTNFGKTLFDADLQLKRFVVGYDESGNPIRTSVPGYQSVLSRYVAYGPDPSKKSGVTRWWISPKQMTLKYDSTSRAFVFDTVQMQVQTQPLVAGTDPAWDKAATDFATEQTQDYDAFAAEVPAYQKAKELGKIVAVIKWMKDNQIATDYQWAKNYQPTFVPTPREVTRITSPNVTFGNYYTYVTGGVQYSTPNTYAGDTGPAAQMKAVSTAAASSSTDGVSWTFNSNSQTYNAVAVSADLFKSVGAYSYSTTDASAPTVTNAPFALNRTYSSFAVDKNVGFGPGWDFIPATLSDIMPGFFGLCSGTLTSYPYKLAIMTPAGRETYTYNCTAGYVPDDPTYHSKLVRNTDGSFTVTTKDRTLYTFSFTTIQTEYQLVNEADPNNPSGISWTYTSNNAVAAITNMISNQQITFAYNASGQISSVSAPNGTTSYAYDANGDLISASDQRGNITNYTYGPAHFLKSITDRAGTKLIDNTYDATGKVIAQTDARGVSRTINYSTSTGSVAWTDSNGRFARTGYDGKARLLQSINPIGATTTYTYGSTSNTPTSITNALGQVTNITYDAFGNPTTLIAPDGGKVQYTWDNSNNLAQVSDQRYVGSGGAAKVTSYTYDANGNRLQSNIAGITTTNYTYTPQGKVSTITDQSGNKIQFTYNAMGLPATMQDQFGKITSYTYDAAGHLTQVTDPNGVTTTYTYDGNGNRLTMTTPAGVTSYAYDLDDRLVSATDPTNAATAFSYDQFGNLANVTDPLGNTESYLYDPYGNLVKNTDPLQHSTSLTYDALNREASYTTPLGKQWNTTYDSLGNITSVTFADGSTQSFVYDTLNRLLSTRIGSTTLAYTYDTAGRLAKVTGPAGATTYAYDIKDRLTSVTDPYGNVVSYRYDGLDNLTRITYPDGKTIQNQFDAANRLTQQTDWNGGSITYTYTPIGAPSNIIYPNGITKTFTYDSANRLASIVYGNTTQPTLFRQTFMRDARGFVTRIAEDDAAGAGLITNYQYDAAGKLVSTVDTAGATTTYAFDSAGNATAVNVTRTILAPVVSTTTANVFTDVATTTTTNVKTGSAATVTKTITTPSRRGIPAGSPVTTYATSTTMLTPATTTASTFASATSTATATSSPATTTNVAQSYATTTTSVAPTTTDTGTALITTTSTTTTVTLTKITIATTSATILKTFTSVTTTLVATPKYATTANTYSQDNELVASSISGTDPTTNITYIYDANGDLQSASAGTITKNYSWTQLGQLAAATASNAPLPTSFTYDASGKRITKSAGSTNIFYDAATTTTATQTSGTATTVTATTTVTYRGTASTVSATSTVTLIPSTATKTSSTVAVSTATTTAPETTKTTISQSYATTTIALPSKTATDGRGTVTTVNATTTTVALTKITTATTSSTFMVAGTGTTLRYVNDVSVSNDRVLEEMNTSNVANRINVWGAGGLVSSGGASAAARLYPLTDAQGTTRFLTDSSGNVVQAYSYSPYGQLTSTLSATTTPYLYTGENLDQETGLQYLRARYYDPATGRFISRDPMRGTLTNPITQNPYIYAGDNPTAYVDPSGQQAEEIIEEGLPLLEKVADGCAEGGMAAIRALGQLGQLLSEVEQNSTRIPSITQTATYRIPDGLNESLGLLQEVKNASYQALTKQLIDFLLYAQQNGYIFELYVRSNTALSQPLQGLVNTGAIVLKFLGQ